MNLTKLFETQKLLDTAIVEKKGLEGRDMLPEKILALQVELGELANEWRGFKFWSEDTEARWFVPNPNDTCEKCNGLGMLDLDKDFKDRPFCEECDGVGVHFHNPLLEEYVDCLHFILSIGLELNKGNPKIYDSTADYEREENVVDSFLTVFEYTRNLDMPIADYDHAFSRFVELGELLGFTWDQIEQAYYDKNEINHSRQNNGY